MSSVAGQGGQGTIFQTNTTGSEFKTDNSFYTQIAAPWGDLIQASNGLLYGMTSAGGIYDAGSIFCYNIITGKDSILYYFGSGTDGSGPVGSFIQANNGLLYGMTLFGGKNNKGTIISYDITTGKETLLHNFGSGTDGSLPYGSLLQAKDSLLYGMTEEGGVNIGTGWGDGIIFSYNIISGVETDIHDFNNDGIDGYNPEGSLFEAANGLRSVAFLPDL